MSAQKRAAQRPVRLLHCHGSFSLGGKEARVARLMNAFGSDAEHTVLSADPTALGARDALDSRLKVRFPDDAPSLAGWPGVARYQRLARYMQAFDLVLTYNWGAMDAAMAHAMFAGHHRLPPLIHHEDGFNADEAARLKRKRNWFRMIGLARARALVVPSATLEAIALGVWKQPRGRVQRIANGIDIDVDPYQRAPRANALPGFRRRAGEVVIGTLAGLRPVKNLPLLVEAVARAGPNCRLVIVGEGPEGDAIRAAAAAHGLTDRLLLPGFLPDPARYVGLFDIFALSSDSEQAPMALIEAMAAGLPVAATDVGDVRAMVSAVNRDFLAPPGDAAVLGTKLAALAADPALRATLGAANRARAAAEYNEAKMIARYRLLYGSAMRRPDFARH